MLNAVKKLLAGILGPQPSKDDRELMETTQARLLMFGGLAKPGAVLRTLPGVVVHVGLSGDQTREYRIFDSTGDRHIGTIVNGTITYTSR